MHKEYVFLQLSKKTKCYSLICAIGGISRENVESAVCQNVMKNFRNLLRRTDIHVRRIVCRVSSGSHRNDLTRASFIPSTKNATSHKTVS